MDILGIHPVFLRDELEEPQEQGGKPGLADDSHQDRAFRGRDLDDRIPRLRGDFDLRAALQVRQIDHGNFAPVKPSTPPAKHLQPFRRRKRRHAERIKFVDQAAVGKVFDSLAGTELHHSGLLKETLLLRKVGLKLRQETAFLRLRQPEVPFRQRVIFPQEVDPADAGGEYIAVLFLLFAVRPVVGEVFHHVEQPFRRDPGDKLMGIGLDVAEDVHDGPADFGIADQEPPAQPAVKTAGILVRDHQLGCVHLQIFEGSDVGINVPEMVVCIPHGERQQASQAADVVQTVVRAHPLHVVQRHDVLHRHAGIEPADPVQGIRRDRLAAGSIDAKFLVLPLASRHADRVNGVLNVVTAPEGHGFPRQRFPALLVRHVASARLLAEPVEQSDDLFTGKIMVRFQDGIIVRINQIRFFGVAKAQVIRNPLHHLPVGGGAGAPYNFIDGRAVRSQIPGEIEHADVPFFHQLRKHFRKAYHNPSLRLSMRGCTRKYLNPSDQGQVCFADRRCPVFNVAGLFYYRSSLP